MFCIDYLLSYSSRGRQIVFLINIEETVSESNSDQPGVQRLRVGGGGGCDQDNTHTHTAQQTTSLHTKGKAKLKRVRSSEMDGSGSRNISSIVPWIKPGRKSISSGWLCSGAQPKHRSVYFECLSTSFIRAQIHFRRAVDTLRSKTRTR